MSLRSLGGRPAPGRGARESSQASESVEKQEARLPRPCTSSHACSDKRPPPHPPPPLRLRARLLSQGPMAQRGSGSFREMGVCEGLRAMAEMRGAIQQPQRVPLSAARLSAIMISGARSSVGQSARFTSVRSRVRAPPRPHDQVDLQHEAPPARGADSFPTVRPRSDAKGSAPSPNPPATTFRSKPLRQIAPGTNRATLLPDRKTHAWSSNPSVGRGSRRTRGDGAQRRIRRLPQTGSCCHSCRSPVQCGFHQRRSPRHGQLLCIGRVEDLASL